MMASFLSRIRRSFSQPNRLAGAAMLAAVCAIAAGSAHAQQNTTPPVTQTAAAAAQTLAQSSQTVAAVDFDPSAGLAVPEIGGVPGGQGRALAALVSQTARREGLAIVEPSRWDATYGRGFALEGVAAAGAGTQSATLMVLWTILRSDGAPVDSFVTDTPISGPVGDNPWASVTSAALVDIAEGVVDRLLQLSGVEVGQRTQIALAAGSGLDSDAAPEGSTAAQRIAAARLSSGTQAGTSAASSGTASAGQQTATAVAEPLIPVPIARPNRSGEADRTQTAAATQATATANASTAAPQQAATTAQETTAAARQAAQQAPAAAAAPAPPKPDKPVQVAAVRMGPLPVLVTRVTGAPGDGNQLLPVALRQMLERNGIPLVKGGDQQWFTISGTVDIEPISSAEEQVEIVWRVEDPVGEELGEVRQANALPAGSLNQTWGKDAAYAAAGAADGIIALLRQAGETY